MKYPTTITSKGTITIAAPIRKALGLKTGQKVKLSIAEDRSITIEVGKTIEEFVAMREKLLAGQRKIKPLAGQELKDAIAEAWVSDHR